MAKSVAEGITIYFEGNSVNFDKTASDIKQALGMLKRMTSTYMKEYKKTGDINAFAKAVGNLQDEQRLAALSVQAWADEVAKLKKENKGNTAEFKNAIKQWSIANDTLVKIETELDKNVEKMREFTSTASIGDLNKKLQETGDTLLNVGDKLTTVGQAFKGVSDMAADKLQYATEKAIEFESAFADVLKTVEATPREFERLEIGLRALSKRVPVTADELARIAGLAGQMNVPTDQIIAFTEAMVDFGSSTNITAEQATEDIAQLYNVIGKGGDFSDLDNLLSTIVELGNNSATTEKAIVEMLTNIAGGASRVNMSAEQMVALAATLSSLNLDKGGASAISKILSQIDIAVADNKEALQDWVNISTMGAEEFANAWKNDPGTALLSVLQGLAQTKEAGDNLNITIEGLDVTELRQVDTLSRLTNANKEYSKNLELANSAYKEGTALNEEAAKRYATVESKIQILKNTFSDFALSIGNVFMPLINAVLDIGIRIGEFLNNLSPTVKKIIAIIGSVVAVISPLLLGLGALSTNLGTFVKGLLPKLITNGLTLIKNIGFLKQGLSFLTGPIGLVVAAFALLYATNEEVRTKINELVVSLLGLFKPAMQLIINIVKIAWTLFKQVVNILKIMWQQFAESESGKLFIEIIKQIIGWVQQAIDWISTLIGWLVKATEWFLNLLGVASDFNDVSVTSRGKMNGQGFDVLNSGGYASGGVITLNSTFNVNSNNIGRNEVRQWASWLADDINEELGRRIR